MLEQSQLHLLPNMNEKGIQEFFTSLESDDPKEATKRKETSIEDIEKVKNQLKMIEQGIIPT